jgi:uncharacterized transporter YbjL
MSPNIIIISGISVTAVSVIIGVISAVLLKMKRTKLAKAFDDEYGVRT